MYISSNRKGMGTAVEEEVKCPAARKGKVQEAVAVCGARLWRHRRLGTEDVSLLGLDVSERNQPHRASDSSILFKEPPLMLVEHSQKRQANPFTVHMCLVVDFTSRALTSGFVTYKDTIPTFSLSGSQVGFLKPLVCQAPAMKAESATFKIEISFQIYRILMKM